MRKFKFILPLSATLVAVSPIITLTNCNVSNSNQDTQLAKEVAEKGVSIESTDIKLFEESTIVLNLQQGKTIVAIKIKIGNLIVTEDDVTISGNKITIPAMKMVSTDITILSITFSDDVSMQLSLEVKRLGVSIKSTDIVLNKDSTIVLNLPQGKVITAIRIKIGKTTYSEKDVIIDNNVITIPARLMTCCSVSITSITLEDAKPIIIPFDILTCSWSEIDNLCIKLENDEVDEETFCANILIGDKSISSLEELVGVERTIKINNFDYSVRIIGVLHDTIAQEGQLQGKKAALTFELTNILCDSDGNRLTTDWNEHPYNNYQYLDSKLRMNLTGSGTGEKTWDKTAWEMLIDQDSGTPQLESIIKTTSHTVATTNSWTRGTISLSTYTDKIFVPSYYNFTSQFEQWCKEPQNTIYKYYSNKQAQSEEAVCAARVKTDINGNISAYWIGSPVCYYNNAAWTINSNGSIEWIELCSDETGVSFAFCI